MKDYFIRLFQYDKYANELIYQSIMEVGQPEKPVQLIAHLLASQQIWLKRCQFLPAQGGALWPDWTADRFPAMINENNKQWLTYLNQLTDADFSSSIPYQNSRNEAFNNTLADVLAHVINHGTHHRAQAGQWLKRDGLEKLPVTDYIFYIRDHKTK